MPTGEDLAKISEADRIMMARWLVERADQFKPSFLLTRDQADRIQMAFQGAAVDLVDPLCEDSTMEHAHAVMEKIMTGGTDERG